MISPSVFALTQENSVLTLKLTLRLASTNTPLAIDSAMITTTGRAIGSLADAPPSTDDARLLACDFNGDQKHDILLVSAATGHNLVWYGGQAQAQVDSLPAGGINSVPKHVVARDLDGDGRCDLDFVWPNKARLFTLTDTNQWKLFVE